MTPMDEQLRRAIHERDYARAQAIVVYQQEAERRTRQALEQRVFVTNPEEYLTSDTS